ncbi:hypothetical protein JVU11DRAFT_8745 [Chiua virens]|nr:hypothetical protein JVU11DRAFT_8745 [Chiua virens]
MLLTISALLQLNYLLIIFLNCAVTAGTIVSCRAVRSLLTLDAPNLGKGGSDMELTTGIAVHTPHSSIFGGRRFVDEECMY